jgi:hypothetical protein
MELQFTHALRTLDKIFSDVSAKLRIPFRYALIGGLAVSAWGVIRATEDIDLLADSEPSPLRSPDLRRPIATCVETHEGKAEWRVGDPEDPVPLLLRVTLPRPAQDVGADILWAHKAWQREALIRRVPLSVSRMKVFVLHAQDLVLMKLEAGGPQDLLDVEELLSKRLPELNIRRLQRKAAQLGLGTELRRCLQRRGEKTRK